MLSQRDSLHTTGIEDMPSVFEHGRDLAMEDNLLKNHVERELVRTTEGSGKANDGDFVAVILPVVGRQ